VCVNLIIATPPFTYELRVPFDTHVENMLQLETMINRLMLLSICVSAKNLGVFPPRRIGLGLVNGAVYKGEHKFAFVFKETFELEITDATSGILTVNGHVSHEDRNVQINKSIFGEVDFECSNCTTTKLESFNFNLERATYDVDKDAICLYIKPKNGQLQKKIMYRERESLH